MAAQAVEDAAKGVSGAVAPPRGAGVYHAYNAASKRVMGGKARHEMSLAELEAAAEWLGRNRLREHLHLLEGDHRFGWAVRSR
ncbi:MAG: restriction endonuclease subunit R, partial [Acetobacteraceae bacterium]